MPLPTIPSGNVASALPSGYDVDNSCRFDASSSAYMHITPSSTGVEEKFTFSFWIKYNYQHSSNQCVLFIEGSNGADDYVEVALKPHLDIQFNNGTYARYETNRKFRDPSAWYHIVIAVDTTQSTAGNRLKLYVNGTQETSWATETVITQNDVLQANTSGKKFWLNAHYNGPKNFIDGYLAEVVWIDGTQYAASDFGEFDEDSPTIWKPKDVSGLTFGTNGFYLDFEDSSNLGNDANGGTDLTEVNLAAVDQCSDSPTNNFCVMNPLLNLHNGTYTYAEGNLEVQSDVRRGAYSSFGVAHGKWYCEAKLISFTNGGSSTDLYAIGIASNVSTMANDGTGDLAGSYAYCGTGNKEVADSASSYGDTYTTNDIIGIALNLDDNEVKFYKNGTVQNSGTAISITAPASTENGFYFFNAGHIENVAKWSWNFGNPAYTISSGNADGNGYGNFEYAPPSGFLALCTKNLGSDGG